MAIDPIPLPAAVPGRLYATGFSDVGPDPAMALASVGADVLLCLLTDHDIGLRHFPGFAPWLAANDGGPAWRFAIDDGDVAADDAMAHLVADVAGRLRAGHGIVTHCGAGIGRTSLVCALALLVLDPQPLDQALATVRAARPGAGPENPVQRAHLERLARHFAARR